MVPCLLSPQVFPRVRARRATEVLPGHVFDRGHRAPGPHGAKRRGGLTVHKDAHPEEHLQLVQVSCGISLDELTLDDSDRRVDGAPGPVPSGLDVLPIDDPCAIDSRKADRLARWPGRGQVRHVAAHIVGLYWPIQGKEPRGLASEVRVVLLYPVEWQDERRLVVEERVVVVVEVAHDVAGVVHKVASEAHAAGRALRRVLDWPGAHVDHCPRVLRQCRGAVLRTNVLEDATGASVRLDDDRLPVKVEVLRLARHRTRQGRRRRHGRARERARATYKT
eukprot:scaffold6463_cov69-Phaeocystis_antarctica.AAC.4